MGVWNNFALHLFGDMSTWVVELFIRGDFLRRMSFESEVLNFFYNFCFI